MSPVSIACGTDSVSLGVAQQWIPWEGFRGESNVESWLPKTFSSNPDVVHVSNGKRLLRLTMERELGITAGWLETQNNLPLWFDATSWNSPESFTEFVCSCKSCKCEVSLCIVSWLSRIFVLRIHQLVVLELFSFLPTHEHFVFEYFGELFPLVTSILVVELVLFELQ